LLSLPLALDINEEDEVSVDREVGAAMPEFTPMTELEPDKSLIIVPDDEDMERGPFFATTAFDESL